MTEGAGVLFNCDDVTHGYGCYHLDTDLNNLTKDEQRDWIELVEEYYFEEDATVEELERDIERQERTVEYKREELEEEEETLHLTRQFKELQAKRLAALTPANPRYDIVTAPMGLTDVVH